MISIQKATRWYGQVIGVNNISLAIGPGVTGLLGPNGAGKSTLMQMITGHIRPNQGRVEVSGKDPFCDYPVHQRMGYVPEIEALPPRQTGKSFLRKCAYAHGYSMAESRAHAERVLELVGLGGVQDKKVAAYSRGMQQRLKLGQAVLHHPDIVIMDEPLTGLDPVGRRQVIDLIKTLGQQGKTLLVSSHVLHEIELMTDQVILISRGRVLAEGTIGHIRSLIDSQPHTVELHAARRLDLVVSLLKERCVVNVSLEDGENCLKIRTREPDRFYDTLADLILKEGFEVESFHSPDDNLQAVFDYLVK